MYSDAAKARLHFAEMKRDCVRQMLPAALIVQLRSARLHGVFGIENRRQRLVFDPNEVERLFGGILIDGRNGRDLFADVAHLCRWRAADSRGFAECFRI